MKPIFKSNLLNCVKYIEMSGPFAYSYIRGSYKYPEIYGIAEFYELNGGVFMIWEINSIPHKSTHSIHGFHIHTGSSCGGSGHEPFPESGTHFDKTGAPHPYHSGDLPPVFANNGYAFGSVFTDRLTPKDILEKTIIIHSSPDDFTSQPAGNSGEKIACGVIYSV